MDPSLIARLLKQARGQQDDPVQAGSSAAPAPNDPGLAQAYSQPVSPLPSQAGIPPSSPFLPNQGLEQQAQAQGNMPMHPIIAALVTRMGLLNMLRNRANQQMVGPTDIGNY